MPLLRETVHTLNMQYHCTQINKINKSTVNTVNPGQTPVDISDQPVYALTREIQWRYPIEFQNYFSMMGALHRENVFSMPWTIDTW